MRKPVILLVLVTVMISVSAMGSGRVDPQQAETLNRAMNISKAFVATSVKVQTQAHTAILDQIGEAHVRFNQMYRGIPVFEGQIITHVDLASGTVRGITRSLREIGDLDVNARIGEDDAVALGLIKAGVSSDAQTATDLMVFVSREDGSSHLAWRVHVVVDNGLVDPVDWMTFVDAHDGSVLLSYNNLHTGRPTQPPPDDGTPATGTAHTLYVGTVNLATESYPDGTFGMKDPTRGGIYTTDMLGKKSGDGTMFRDADNTWGNFSNSDRATAGTDAHFGAVMTWDYFLNIHGRNGIFNDGTGTYSRVHYGRDYNNAYWSSSCKCMTYGDGDGTLMSPLVALDVAAHEMTHGVTSATAELVYSGESGGLNESMSDIFAAAVEVYASAYSSKVPDFWIGEDLWTPATPGDALRYMDDPTLDGRSIDHYSQFTSTMDVHYSSGLANHVFYLMCEGGTNQTSGMSVTAIGMAKAEKIFYRALTVYMTPGTTFAEARTATVQAATDLYDSATAAAAAEAWEACGVN